MLRRRLLGGLLLVAGVGGFVAVWSRIAWMVYGGPTDYLQLLGLGLGLALALAGAWLLILSHASPPRAAERAERGPMPAPPRL